MFPYILLLALAGVVIGTGVMWLGRWEQKAQSVSYTCNVFCNNYWELILSDEVLHIGYLENCFQEGPRNISQESQNTPTITPNLEKLQKRKVRSKL